MSMPDKWEYPWFAAWDLAFQCVALAHVDPAFAKYQLILICREWFQHPNGALPAYEWSFDDVNPPVQAWAALEVFAIDGATDVHFLRRVFDKLLVNFTWWVNREDADGSNLFEGGFLGLDNIGPIDRDHLPVDGMLEQSDATAWMALYSLHMATMASVLRRHGQPTQDLTVKFLEHFSLIKAALDGSDLWDEPDGFFYDRIKMADGTLVPIKVRSVVGDPAGPRQRRGRRVPDPPGRGVRQALRRHARTPRRRPGDHGGERPRPRHARETASSSSAWWASIGSPGSSSGCSTSPSSCRRTACGPSPSTTGTIRTSSGSGTSGPRSTTSPPNRPPTCSAATPIGGARSGFP